MKGHKDAEGTRASLLAGKAKRAGTVQPGEGKAQGDLTNKNERLQRERSQALLSSIHMRTRDNGHKLKRRKFHRNIRKHLFAVEMTEHWQVAQRGVEVSPSLGYSEAI